MWHYYVRRNGDRGYRDKDWIYNPETTPPPYWDQIGKFYLTEKEQNEDKYTYTGYDQSYKLDQSSDLYMEALYNSTDDNYHWDKSTFVESSGTQSKFAYRNVKYFLSSEITVDNGQIAMADPVFTTMERNRIYGSYICKDEKMYYKSIKFHAPTSANYEELLETGSENGPTDYTYGKATINWNTTATTNKPQIQLTGKRYLYNSFYTWDIVYQDSNKTIYRIDGWYPLRGFIKFKPIINEWESMYANETGSSANLIDTDNYYWANTGVDYWCYVTRYNDNPWLTVEIGHMNTSTWTSSLFIESCNDVINVDEKYWDNYTKYNNIKVAEHTTTETINYDNLYWMDVTDPENIYKVDHSISYSDYVDLFAKSITYQAVEEASSPSLIYPVDGWVGNYHYKITKIPKIYSVADLFKSICTYLDIDYQETDDMRAMDGWYFLINNNFIATGKTFRDLMSYIAKMLGGYCHVNQYGYLIIDWFRKTNIGIDETQYVDVIKQNYSTPLITKIQVSVDSNSKYINFGAGTSSLYINDDPLFLVENTQELNGALGDIYTKVTNYSSYVPATITLQSNDFNINVGDILTITKDNNTFTTLIFSKTMDKSGVILESTGNPTRETYKSSDYKTFNEVNGKYSETEETTEQVGFEVGNSINNSYTKLYVKDDGVYVDENGTIRRL